MVIAGTVETVFAFYGTKDVVKDPSEPGIRSPEAIGKSGDASIIVNRIQRDKHNDEELVPGCVPAEVCAKSKPTQVQVPFIKRIKVKMTIDRISRIAFPLVFIASNVTYWVVSVRKRT